MKKISVIVPIYNTEKYLSRCIESLINQTYKNLEIILVNDGSTDNSLDVCYTFAKKDKRIKVYNKDNGGQSSARNLALEKMTGDFIGFVDSDDWIALDTYEYLIKLINENSADIAFVERVYTQGSINIINNNICQKIYEQEKIIEEYLNYGMKTGNYGLPNYLYKKDLFEGIHFPDGRICEDIVTNYKLMKKANKLVKSNKICYYYFQDNRSTTRNKFSKRDFDLVFACDELIQLSENENQQIKKMVKEKRDRTDFSLLAKIAYYGIKDNENYEDEIKKMLKRLRKNYIELMFTNMKIVRKIQLTFFVVNYSIVRKLMRYIRKEEKSEKV